MNRTQQATRILFWIAFGIFLAVSIPHIAWVFHSFEPQGDGFDIVWWALAYGFAVAIDAVICWLSFIKSTDEGNRDTWLIWAFIATLVIMSWYFNWIYAKGHDPSNPTVKVWDIQIIPQFGPIGGWSIGTVTPVIISAMPVFTIAYTFVLSKVTKMKAQASMSLAELQAAADEAILRAEAERRIRDARKGASLAERSLQFGKGLIGAADELREELARNKRDPRSEQEQILLDFFRTTPELLADEKKEHARVLIAEMLKSKDMHKAEAWRLKIAAMLANEAEQNAAFDASQTADAQTEEDAEIESRVQQQNGAASPPDDVHQSNEVKQEIQGEIPDEKRVTKPLTKAKQEPPKWASHPALATVMQSYPNVQSWLSKSQATASAQEVIEITGLTQQRILGALKRGVLKYHTRGKERILIETVIDLLKQVIDDRQKGTPTDKGEAVVEAAKEVIFTAQNEGATHHIEDSDLSDIDLSEIDAYDVVEAGVNVSNGYH